MFFKKSICVFMAALSVGAMTTLPASVMPGMTVAAASVSTTDSSVIYKTLSLNAGSNEDSNIKRCVGFYKNGKTVSKVTYNNSQVATSKMSDDARKKQLLYSVFKDGKVYIYASSATARKNIDVVITYSDKSTQRAKITVTQAYTGGNKICHYDDKTKAVLSRSGKKIKRVFLTDSLKPYFTYSVSSDKSKAMLTAKKATNATAKVCVLYTDDTTEMFSVKILHNLTPAVITKDLVSYDSNGSGFTYCSTDSNGHNRSIISYTAESKGLSLSYNKDAKKLYVNAAPATTPRVVSLKVVSQDTFGYKLIQKFNIKISARKRVLMNVGDSITYTTGASSVKVMSGSDYLNVNKSGSTCKVVAAKGSLYTPNPVRNGSSMSYQLDSAKSVLRFTYSNGTYDEKEYVISWPSFSTDAKSSKRWSYDNFINSGIVNWGGKKFSWYTMLATNENATGVSWELPITNLSVLCANLPQSDKDRLNNMRKTNPKATMQDAFKPWSSDSIYWKDEGFIRDKDGFICVAAPLNLLNNGTVKRYGVIATPWGPGKIYDACPEGSWDIFVRSHCFSGFFNYDIVHKK